MKIDGILCALTEAIDAEVNLATARIHYQRVIDLGLDTTATYANVNADWQIADEANAALSAAIVEAPDSKVKEAIVNGVLLHLLRRHTPSPGAIGG